MAQAVQEFNYIPQPITFPIRAAFVKNSIPNLKFLLEEVRKGIVFSYKILMIFRKNVILENNFRQVTQSTLTVWTGKDDKFDVKDIVELQESVGKNRLYLDLSPEQILAFRELSPAEYVSIVPTDMEIATSSGCIYWKISKWALGACVVAVLVKLVLYKRLVSFN